MALSEIERAHCKAIADALPPFTQEQRDALVLLLRPSALALRRARTARRAKTPRRRRPPLLSQ